jgi:hypothetical protein
MSSDSLCFATLTYASRLPASTALRQYLPREHVTVESSGDEDLVNALQIASK